MFSYDLSGKQALLVLTEAFVEQLKPIGVESPVVAKVHKVEDRGLWLDATRFPLCPIDAPRLYGPDGESFCHAHLFVPADAIVSVAAFPRDVPELSYSTIGFRPARKKK